MNDRVEAKCDGWTKYFAGTIIHVHSNGTYDIQFDDGEKKTNVDKGKMRPKTTAFGINDRIEAKCPGWTKYFRAPFVVSTMMGLMILNSMMARPSVELQKWKKSKFFLPGITNLFFTKIYLSTWLGSVYKPSVLDGQNISREHCYYR